MRSSKTTSGKSANAKSPRGRQHMLPASRVETPVTRNLAKVSISDAISIALSDGNGVSSNPDLYARDNAITYWVLINTWLFQVEEVSERGCFELLEAITKVGLFAVIAACDAIANEFVRTEYGDNDFESSIPGFLTTLVTSARNDKELLQILRYPKRFSPNGADLISKASIENLLYVNDRCKQLNRNGLSRYWVDRIRVIVHDMLHGYSIDWNKGFFSTGVAADAARPLMDKLHAYATWDCSLFHDALYPIGLGYKYRSDVDAYTAKVVAVPKSYKAARVIAEEHAYRQFHMQAIRIEVERLLKVNGYEGLLDLHDQRPNQELAWQGSKDGVYATIDLSSASDSIARTLAFDVLPATVVHDLDKYLPKRLSDGVHNRLMHMFCTSGSAVTFPVESVIFLAIAIAVNDVVQALTSEVLLPPRVFGDDIVVDARVFDTTVDVLTQLGFSVNQAKSYGPTSTYRESCGVEYTCGYDLQSVYWPRATLTWDSKGVATAIAQLCALEHRLYKVYKAKLFLVNVVRALEPRMTSHPVGTECVDLWEDIPTFLIGYAPGLDATYGDGAERHRHLVLKTRRRRDRLFEVGESGYTGLTVVEMWRFSRFLLQGPSYDDELLRLLRVSTKPPTLASDADAGEQYWDYVKE